ncbi:hypothetical protein [Klebsiella phage vB_KpnP_BUCT712]|uniref:Uncharacterized protein n=1 Tax=Klebsiella phage BUCT631 TaxID=2996057 RepID=A0A9E9C4H9_9CAUD|nr:hypothetical protein [Klebsiella phage BUCT631]WCS67887.1 hypothetical protein [Klebsiella phage vB_KpnP_BUCT712]
MVLNATKVFAVNVHTFSLLVEGVATVRDIHLIPSVGWLGRPTGRTFVSPDWGGFVFIECEGL